MNIDILCEIILKKRSKHDILLKNLIHIDNLIYEINNIIPFDMTCVETIEKLHKTKNILKNKKGPLRKIYQALNESYVLINSRK